MQAKFIIFLFALISFSACNSNDRSSDEGSSVANAVEPSTPVTAVLACNKLTLDDLRSVYSDKTFKIEVERNDQPNIYEALSACRYQEEGREAFEKYYVDLEVRAQQTSGEALKKLKDHKEMDYENKGKAVSGYGDGAYFYNNSMVGGGPSLEFVKDNVYFKLNIQTIKSGSFASLEGDIMNLAKRILD